MRCIYLLYNFLYYIYYFNWLDNNLYSIFCLCVYLLRIDVLLWYFVNILYIKFCLIFLSLCGKYYEVYFIYGNIEIGIVFMI